MSQYKALFQISLLEQSDVFLVSEYESKKCLCIKILDIKQSESYVGQASDLELRTQAAGIRLTFNDYIKELKKALFQFTSSGCTYIYSLLKEKENYIFKWKSVDHDETIINLGNVQMQRQSHVTLFYEVLTSLSKEVKMLNNKIENYENEVIQYKSQAATALNQLSEAIALKENLEKEMFAKFVIILNEKKKAIKDKKYQNDSKPTTSNNKFTKKKPTSNQISDSSDEDEPLDINKPGTSKSLKRDSFLSLEDDPEVFVKPSKMRNRKVPCKRLDEVKCSKQEKPRKLIIEDNDDEFLLNNL